MKTNGRPMPSNMRDIAKNLKSTSPLILVMSNIASAQIAAPMAIRMRGCTLPESRPATGIMSAVTRPPGESTRPAQVAV